MRLQQAARPGLLLLVPPGRVPVVDGESRHVPRAPAGHLGHALLVQPRAVLDRVDAGADGAEETGAAESVTRDGDSGHVGLVDDRLDLLAGEDGPARIEPRRADAPARRDLDHVGAGPEHLPDLGAHAVRAVALGVGHPGHDGRRQTLARGGVGDAVGRRHDDHADLEPRARDQPTRHRVAEACVQAPEVPGGRAARGDRGPQREERLRREVHEALVLVRGQVQPPGSEVDVTVDQARQDETAGQVHEADVRPEGPLPAHGLDPRSVDHERRVRARRASRPVDQDPADQRRLHRAPTIHEGRDDRQVCDHWRVLSMTSAASRGRRGRGWT